MSRNEATAYHHRVPHDGPRMANRGLRVLVSAEYAAREAARNAPREMPGYEGDGPATTLRLVLARRAHGSADESAQWHRMWIEQRKR